ncbi:hypothetical protein OHA25_60530 (plasmid) [Nonomuraea sp. NBC_00507]
MVVKLAAPLYQLQSLVYTVAGEPMLDPTMQDGQLLNDLAAHLRRINPDALTDNFARRVRQAATRYPEAVLLCDDMRAPDAATLVDLGFHLVRVHAAQELRLGRKNLRGDLTAGQDDHPTEASVALDSHHDVRNDGGLEDLRQAARTLARQVAS